MGDVPGFPTGDDETTKTQPNQKAKLKKSGGFQSMGLSYEILKGITKRGYNIPTPIQRKTIPLILEGRDVVAMAKTGSGKTACFLIPMFEKLKRREPTKGARALILSPTRELAIQTYKFIKDLGKFIDLKTILVLGGDSMDSQFSAIHTCPDVIVATPGRFLHLCVEMDLKLSSIEYAVFDEADRLFEMGFGDQLNETLNRLPNAKQMVMFSATLPKLLVDFAKAGLSDPTLIRLDVESKLPEALALKFLYCRPDERYTSLVVLLKNVIPENSQTVVFVGTQHHVELVSFILDKVGISNTVVYSSLDPSARKINTAKFVHKKVSVLIVTDVAARGIDIPSLDYVVNVHFPGKPKLFVHRVGRCARAGRSGTAFSIFSTDDQAHLLDLHLFLNRSLNLNDNCSIGVAPQDIMEEEHLTVLDFLKSHHIAGTYRTSENAYKKYISSRPVASADSNKRIKAIKFYSLKPLDDFMNMKTENNNQHQKKKSVVSNENENKKLLEQKHDLLVKMRNFRPSGTIFELNSVQKTVQYAVMKEKRSKHSKVIEKFRTQMEEHEKQEKDKLEPRNQNLPESNDADVSNTFDHVVTGKKRKNTDNLYKMKTKKKKKKLSTKDTENYIPYQAADKHTEDGFAINSFERQTASAEFSVVENNIDRFVHKPGTKRWDRYLKKFVAVQDPRSGKIRTESGIWIPSSFKTGRYDDWKEKTKIEERIQSEEGLEESHSVFNRYPVSRHARHNVKVEAKKLMGNTSIVKGRKISQELKNPEQIVKERLRIEISKNREKINKTKKDANRKQNQKKMRTKKRRN